MKQKVHPEETLFRWVKATCEHQTKIDGNDRRTEQNIAEASYDDPLQNIQ